MPNAIGGPVCDEDRAANDAAMRDGSRLLSACNVNGEGTWIITEADRGATAVLLPRSFEMAYLEANYPATAALATAGAPHILFGDVVICHHQELE